TSFALPKVDQSLYTVSGSNGGCAGGVTQEWASIDVTGDGKPDLVLTASCSDTTVGTTHWQVYSNTGSGFAASPASFALPKVDQSLYLVSGSNGGCAAGGASVSQEWASLDLLGDGKLDLVLTASCTDASIGTTAWSVYPGVCSP
ncbi:MAG TPA: VCBS repeat-containing protein, partial [Polyangiaceae bacterium]